MIIYRVENSKGHGPFRAPNHPDPDIIYMLLDKYDTGHAVSPFPLPHNDGIDELRWCHTFGTLSIERLIHWFPHEFHERLAMHGFHIAVYLIEDEEDAEVVVGKHQVAFDYTCATRIKTMSFNHACAKIKLAA